MKKIYSLLVFALCILSFSSCEDFMDIHKEYIEGGEIIYAPKPDTVSFIAGKGRILFKCRAYNSPNVKSINLYWNERLDSLIIPVSLSAGYDSLEVVLDNMIEKSYTFNIQLEDNFGHKSLSVTDFGSSYGDFYQSTLIDRRVKKISLSDNGGLIDWYSAGEGLVANEIKYTKSNGAQTVIRMPAKDYSVLCPDLKAGSQFEFRSLYIPEEEAIDTFYTEWSKYEEDFPAIYTFDRSNWEVLACSDQKESDGGGMKTLIDGDLGTFWHSAYGPDAPLPHWAVIDMTSAKKICRFDVYRRPGNTDGKTVQLFIGNNKEADASGWTQVAEGVFPASGDKVQIDIPASTSTDLGRYLKIVLPDSNRAPFTSIAEIYVYGN